MKSGIFVPVNARKSHSFSAVSDNLQAANAAFTGARNCRIRTHDVCGDLPGGANGSN